jgi:chemotaxis protein methyltransferase CheR
MIQGAYNESNADLLDIEIQLLMDAIFLRYGYDFRNYSKAHIKRRVLHRLSISMLPSVSQLQDKVLRDREFFTEFLDDLSINVTEMFRDPEFYKSLRENIIPKLRTYAYFKIWHAGCSTGEEVYSHAILLKEEGLLDRCQVYATDFNRKVLSVAKEGVYQKSEIEQYEKNYQLSGGMNKLSDYYKSRYGSVIFDKDLAGKIVFADHNLVTDTVFADVNLILCRNVLIYFEKGLQDNVIGLFYDSLVPSGILCLGSKESIKFTRHENLFEIVDTKQKIYKKKIL